MKNNVRIWLGNGWEINTNCSYGIPGYLFIRSLNETAERFLDMSVDDFNELGKALRIATTIVEKHLNPQHMFVGKFGLVPNHNIHFHIIPVYSWMIKEFHKHPQYSALQKYNPTGYPIKPDAAELIIYFWRELCFSGKRPKPFDDKKLSDILIEHAAKF